MARECNPPSASWFPHFGLDRSPRCREYSPFNRLEPQSCNENANDDEDECGCHGRIPIVFSCSAHNNNGDIEHWLRQIRSANPGEFFDDGRLSVD